MAKRIVAREQLRPFLELVPRLLQLPHRKVWSDYDVEADVLYLSFRRPQAATDAEDFIDDGVIIHLDGATLVGVTILDASTRPDSLT